MYKVHVREAQQLAVAAAAAATAPPQQLAVAARIGPAPAEMYTTGLPGATAVVSTQRCQQYHQQQQRQLYGESTAGV